MSDYIDIVQTALDVSNTHAEDDRTEEELSVLMSKLRMEFNTKQLETLGRYVEFSKWRYHDSLRSIGL